MGSSTNTSDYQSTLNKISAILTEDNVRELSFLCDGAFPGTAENIRNASELLDVLQNQDFISEQDVNQLVDWLDELKIFNASKLLKNYRRLRLESKCTFNAISFTLPVII